jgi:hypothetical protein
MELDRRDAELLFQVLTERERLSDFPWSFIPGFPPQRSPNGPPCHHSQAGDHGTSRFSHLKTQRMHGVYDRAGSAGSSR